MQAHKFISNMNDSNRISQSAWTAKRCSRLLRPLASRIKSLRLHAERQENYLTHQSKVSTNKATKPKHQPSELHGHGESRYHDARNTKDSNLFFGVVQDADAIVDPDWVPQPERLKLKRKYSAFAANRVNSDGTSRNQGSQRLDLCHGSSVRGRISKRRSEVICRAPGEIVVPTPIIARSAKILPNSDLQSQNCPEDTEEQNAEGTNDVNTAEDGANGLDAEGTFRTTQRQRKKKHLHGPVAQRLKELKMCKGLVSYKTIEGTCWALDNIFQATKAHDDKTGAVESHNGASRCAGSTLYNSKGSRSLLATCARQVPKYIAIEEKWIQEDDIDDDDIDVIDEVFTELEALGSCQGQGWPYLRDTIRAQSMYLICAAIRENVLFSMVTGIEAYTALSKALLTVCTTNGALQEAETLMTEIIKAPMILKSPALVDGEEAANNLFFLAPASLDRSLFETPTEPVLQMLRNYAVRRSRQSVLWDTLSDLISSARLPVEWLATKDFMYDIWPAVIKSLSDFDNDYASAVKFLALAISCSCGFGKDQPFDKSENMPELLFAISKSSGSNASDYLADALNNTIFSLCTVLPTLALAPANVNTDVIGSYPQDILWAICNFSIEIFNKLIKVSRQEDICISDSKVYTTRITTVVATSIILSANIPGYLRNITDLLEHTEAYFQSNALVFHSTKYNVDIPDGQDNIIFAIASCCAKATGTDGFEHLQTMIDAVLSFSRKIASLPYTTWFMKKLCLDAAVAFSERSECASHAAYVHDIERTLGSLESFNARNPKLAATTCNDSTNRDATRAANIAGQQTPVQQKSRQRGFRWEEGICEWISATPASALLAKRSVMARLRGSNTTVTTAVNKVAKNASGTFQEGSVSPTSSQNMRGKSQSSLCDDVLRHPEIHIPIRPKPRYVLASVDVNVGRSCGGVAKGDLYGGKKSTKPMDNIVARHTRYSIHTNSNNPSSKCVSPSRATSNSSVNGSEAIEEIPEEMIRNFRHDDRADAEEDSDYHQDEADLQDEHIEDDELCTTRSNSTIPLPSPSNCLCTCRRGHPRSKHKILNTRHQTSRSRHHQHYSHHNPPHKHSLSMRTRVLRPRTAILSPPSHPSRITKLPQRWKSALRSRNISLSAGNQTAQPFPFSDAGAVGAVGRSYPSSLAKSAPSSRSSTYPTTNLPLPSQNNYEVIMTRGRKSGVGRARSTARCARKSMDWESDDELSFGY